MNGRINRTVITVGIIGILIFYGISRTATADSWFDSYGKIPWAEEQAHLHNFAIFLRRNPDMIGYVAFNWGTKAEYKEMKSRAARAQKFLVHKLGISSKRIIVIPGGIREKPRTILQPSKKDLPPLDFSSYKREKEILANRTAKSFKPQS